MKDGVDTGTIGGPHLEQTAAVSCAAAWSCTRHKTAHPPPGTAAVLGLGFAVVGLLVLSAACFNRQESVGR